MHKKPRMVLLLTSRVLPIASLGPCLPWKQGLEKETKVFHFGLNKTNETEISQNRTQS